MPQPLPPILLLYDPAEFWEEVRSVVRAEVAEAQAGASAVTTALQQAGRPNYPSIPNAAG